MASSASHGPTRRCRFLVALVSGADRTGATSRRGVQGAIPGRPTVPSSVARERCLCGGIAGGSPIAIIRPGFAIEVSTGTK